MAGELLMSISQDERERAMFRSRRMYQEPARRFAAEIFPGEEENRRNSGGCVRGNVKPDAAGAARG